MKRLFFFLAISFNLQAFCQNKTRHFRYDFKLGSFAQFELLPKETKVLEAQFIWHTVKDERFQLVYLEEVSAESDFEGEIGKDNWDDTLLFDLQTHKLYMYNARKCFQFEKRHYPLNREGKFVSKDTLIDCPSTLAEFASPTPTLVVGKRGVAVFKTSRFTIKYRDAAESNINLYDYFKRYRGFAFDAKKPPFTY